MKEGFRKEKSTLNWTRSLRDAIWLLLIEPWGRIPLHMMNGSAMPNMKPSQPHKHRLLKSKQLDSPTNPFTKNRTQVPPPPLQFNNLGDKAPMVTNSVVKWWRWSVWSTMKKINEYQQALKDWGFPCSWWYKSQLMELQCFKSSWDDFWRAEYKNHMDYLLENNTCRKNPD